MNDEKVFELSAERRAVIDCVDAYESAGAAEREDLRGFLAGIDDEFQSVAIEELVKVDMEYRFLSGRPKTAGEYIEQYPEIVQSAESSHELLQYESQLRERTRDAQDDSTQASTPTERELPAGDLDIGQTAELPAAGPQEATLAANYDTTRASSTQRRRATHIGRFRIDAELGHGTFGVVYRCHDEQLRRDVAIKIPHSSKRMPAKRIKEFLHEAQVSARMKHPGIVTILDTGETEEGRGYIVYELIRGITLKDRIAAGDFDREQAVRWIAEVADALHHAHTHDLVHRDIKPANILVDEEDKTHLTDFGLAKIDDQFFTDDTGRVLGTVAYMNPEQASGQAHWASPQSDIYSLGVVLYELLCGRRPFKSSSSMDLIKQVEQRPPAPPRTVDDSIPRPLEEICLKAMAKNPDDRYRTAADMATALRAALAPRTGTAPWVRAVKIAITLTVLVVAGFFIRDAMITSPPVPSPDLSVPWISSEVHLQRPDDVERGDHHPLANTHLPLSAGDRVQLIYDFQRPAYPYVIWYDSQGDGDLKWPPPVEQESSDAPVEQAQRDRLLLPVGADNSHPLWYQLSGTSTGPQLIVVGLTEEPLTDEELNKMTDWKLELPPRLAERNLVVRSYPTPRNEGLEHRLRSETDNTRGDNTAVVGSAKTAVPRDFVNRIEDIFVSYSLLVFPVQAGNDSSSAGQE